MTSKNLLKTIVLPPASGGQATATLIFAHGLGDTGAGWYDVAQMLSRRPALKHVRFILPNSPVQPVSLNMGMKVSLKKIQCSSTFSYSNVFPSFPLLSS
jgi:predicted esterase